MKPTHWMDSRRLAVTDKWLQSPDATSDYRAFYTTPARMTKAGVRPLYPCETCSGTEYGDDGDRCDVCGGSSGLSQPLK